MIKERPQKSEVMYDLMESWKSVVDGRGQSDGDGGCGEGVRTCLVVGGRGRRQDEQTDGTQQLR